ncbi:MAG TPA: hypothetical protein PKJ48_01400 [Cyclobacteriaceae bacterium]|nr:hypothetical protein [Cyclobacteriaceae bacterium]HMX49206.1 hypothetical protein [Cyclobacteriaceae bacterium]HMY92752.1 hypothetical protein [Cyclobacteriaceae bacterium]HNC12248.1 hypothetical protein [Cyclobacteriaceae bacterium]HNE96995.1 hypothetical protein [Cyclobacteriaceae bacterium]
MKTSKVWHIQHVRYFTPFVVVVGGKYFLPVLMCLIISSGS